MSCTQNSESIALTEDLSTGKLQADVILSEDPENIAKVVTDGLFVSASDLVIPTGSILAWGGGAAPTGWALCDGTAVSRSDFSVLFGVFGITYGGGDGSTTFNLPDIQGRVIVGQNTANADVSTMGGTEGLAAASRSPKHNSSISPNPHAHTGGFVTSGAGAGGGVSGTGSPASTDPTTLSVGPGGSRPTDTPAYVVLRYIVKT